MLNIPNIKKLRDAVAASETFDMSSYSSCFMAHMEPAGLSSSWFQDMNTVLGITQEQLGKLIMPKGYSEPGTYTQEQALATLDHLISTGEVKWLP